MKKIIISALIVVFILTGIFFLNGCGTSSNNQESYNPNIVPSDFTTDINNKYLTFTPGKTFVYEGDTEEGTEHIEVVTLDETKQVMGVGCRIVWDRVWLNDELIEDTKDWYAQDKDGNVWYFGEESKTLEDGAVVSTEGSWEAGVDGAKPGIVMLADPEAGIEYRQEYFKGEAEDMGKVESLSESAKTPYGDFENCLKTRDWTPLESNVDEYKYYSVDVGNLVLEEGVYSKEIVSLIDIKTE
jgi:hypothetical protein